MRVVGFEDEIYAENCSLKHRSEENRKRCIALEQKVSQLESKYNNARKEVKVTQKKCNEELSDMELQLAGAVDTIEALKLEHRKDKTEYYTLMKEYNDREAEARWLRGALDHVKQCYAQAMEIVKRSEQDNAHLKEVNTKLVGELRRLNE